MSVTLCKRKLPSGNIQFYLAIYSPTEGKKNETLFTVKPENLKEKKLIAESIRNQRELEILSNDTIFKPKHLDKISLFDYIDNYIETYDKADIRMIKSASNKLKEFIKNPNFKIKDLTETHFLKFGHFLNNDPKLKGDSPHSYWKRFKKIITQANRDKLIDESVYRKVHFKKRGDLSDTMLTKQVLTEEELQTLFETECGNNEIKRAFLFACYSGLGYAEIKTFSWKHHVTNDRLIIKRIKTGTEINIALSKKALSLLGTPNSTDEKIFDITFQGKHISETSINKTLSNWLKKARIDKHITFYCGRHTFATRLLIKGADLKTVSQCLGHKSIQNTVKYLNYVNSIKDAATSNLD
ncbi:site-specific integrase [Chryseobacterium chendengshani]|uniref:site-specific integrase n=1 Tax=Chryseobacterium sp. LJ668 TaxID=2864040 RepID=UPI001C693A92|nr:site-specific integrase [Chryseobacterium sp. LJ668]MBW8522157.1 site-specific integrase [Chryseobacterium sp. LJ668]QYK17804.1 site-specific integrase [Chryseobacterium sp. LJ668]